MVVVIGDLLDDTIGTFQFLQHSSVDCLNKALERVQCKSGTRGHEGYESCGRSRESQFSISGHVYMWF